MNVIASIMRTFAVALVLVLTATGLWAAGAEEEAPAAAAADKKYVTDPTTGKPVVAPEYGGTITLVNLTETGRLRCGHESSQGAASRSAILSKIKIRSYA